MPILILDEDTSALDAVTGARIQGAFDKLAQVRATIKNAERIILIDGGEIMQLNIKKTIDLELNPGFIMDMLQSGRNNK
ncbi:MAG: hypothetical protein GX663_06410 [Clostridiales bacterium]|nr:hypothetical protein [Clostridiales bacterium]